jgi:hypothetical protein
MLEVCKHKFSSEELASIGRAPHENPHALREEVPVAASKIQPNEFGSSEAR